ncbi:MAG TPA: hypothetical protein VIG89_01175 [Candidatus Acidoferrales bacterium]
MRTAIFRVRRHSVLAAAAVARVAVRARLPVQSAGAVVARARPQALVVALVQQPVRAVVARLQVAVVAGRRLWGRGASRKWTDEALMFKC